MAVKELSFALIYVDELEKNQKFYERYLGFQKMKDFAPGEIWGKMGDVGCWIGSGYEKKDTNAKTARATVMFGVDSVGALFEELKKGGEKLIHEAPVEMKDGVYWLQFADPTGNVVEVLGGR